MNAQDNVKWGEFSDEELNLNTVPFEPEANAVILHEEGDLIITNYGYEITEYSRIKILNTEGYEYSVIERTYNPKNPYSRVELVKGQTINFENGKIEITPLKKNDVIIENQNETTNAYKVVFPNVKTGSIIEYKLKIKSSSNLYSSPWRFQNRIPTITSKLKLKSSSVYDYRVIQFGKTLLAKYGKAKGRKDWELTNVPSLKSYSLVYNPNDYADRIMIQHSTSNFQHDSYLSASNWTEFKKRMKKDILSSVENVNFFDYANKIENGKTELETLGNCIQYIQGNYNWEETYSLIPYSLKNNLLKNKSGYSADLNVLLNGILKSKNISVELVLNSGRNNGKLLLNYPALSRMQCLQNLVTLKTGEKILIDAAISNPQDIRYLHKNMYNQYVLSINSTNEDFLLVEPPVSEIISTKQIEIKPSNVSLKNKIVHNGYYKSLLVDNFDFKQFSSFLINENPIQEIEGWNVRTLLYTIKDENLKLIELECPFKNHLDEFEFNPNRGYPIELDFPYRIIVQTTLKSIQNYEIHAEGFDQEINAFNGNLNYKQYISNSEGNTIITWILLVNKSIFSVSELPELQQFINEYKSTTANSILIKI